MERVLGIGGVFFKSKNPAALQAWYRDVLGVPITEGGEAVLLAEKGDTTVFSPFPAETDYFGSGSQTFMLNFRVQNLDAMLAQARAAGAIVDETVQQESYGKFGWLSDPDGNRIELWEVLLPFDAPVNP